MTTAQVNIKSALHYKTDISGVFELAAPFKAGVSDKRDGCIWVLRNGKKTRLHINASDFDIVGESNVPEKSDDELSRDIEQRFDVMEMIIDGVIHRSIKSVVLSGAPGIGKTFTVDAKLREAAAKRGLNFSQLTGSATAIGLYLTLYDHRNVGDVLVLDDLDSIFADQEALNLLKGALDTGQTRTISWMSASKYLRENDIPNSFEFEGTVIFISNMNFDQQIERGTKLAPHLAALINRCVYLDLGIHSTREIMIRIKQVIKNTNILSDLGLAENHTDDIINWMGANADRMRSLSIRTIIQLANFVRTNPFHWQTMAEMTMIKR
jgi:hypothetical protein